MYGPFESVQMQSFVREGRVISSSLISPDPARGFFPANAFPSYGQWIKLTSPPASPTETANTDGQDTAQKNKGLSPSGTDKVIRPGIFEKTRQKASSESRKNLFARALERTQPRAAEHTQTASHLAEESPHVSPRIDPRQVPSEDDEMLLLTPEPSAITVILVMAELRSGRDLKFLQTLQAHGVAQRIGDSVWLVRTQTEVAAFCDALSHTLSKEDRLFLLDSVNNKTAWYNIGADMDVRIRQIWRDIDT